MEAKKLRLKVLKSIKFCFPESWSDSCSHTCSGSAFWTELHTLQPATLYHMRLIAVNRVGDSEPTKEPIVLMTEEESPEGSPQEIRGREDGSQAIVVRWKPPKSHLRHGKILVYYLGYRENNSSEPFRYQTLEISEQACISYRFPCDMQLSFR